MNNPFNFLKKVATSIFIFIALTVGYVNYVLVGRVDPYKLFIN